MSQETLMLYGYLAIGLNIGGNFWYAWPVWRSPNIRTSFAAWSIWGALDALRFYFMYYVATPPVFSYQMLGSCIAIMLTLLIAWRMKKLIPWSWIDYLVGLAVAGGMYGAFYYGSTHGDLAWWMLTASLIALSLGSLTMYWKTIWNPYSEPLLPWMVLWLSSYCQFYSTNARNYEAIAVAIWLMLLMGVLVVTIIIQRLRLGKPAVIERTVH